jgi:hypothetical protein
MKKRSVVLVFKPGVGKGEIERMLSVVRNSLDQEYHGDQANQLNRPTIHEFNPDHGYPVFYIP